ncbi:MAG: hypothetical protein B7Z37_23220, partial [Verrucomicrobia bacterium 12-59-8]
AAKASGVFDVVRQQFNRDDSPHFMDEDGNLRPRDETRQQDSTAPRDPRSPQFGAGAPPRPAWSAAHAADSSLSPRAPSSASDDTRPWYMPPITPEDLDSHAAPKGRPELNDLVYRTHGSPPPKPEFNDLVYRFNGSPEEAKEHARSLLQNVAAAADTQDTTAQQSAAKAGAQQQGAPPTQSSSPAPPATGMPSQPQTFPQAQFASPVIKAVDARQDSESKSQADKADETPSGTEYAWKFIAGSLVDTALNTAVAVLGGPGKYSYNPNPLRRAWHVDGWLPKIDRESYNRLQDGSELLVFSLAGATNPKNRIHLGIPAPTWRNENDGSPLDKEAANRWLKEYRSNILRTGSGEYQVGVEVKGKSNLLLSSLDRGTLQFAIARGTSDGTMSGSDMFRSMMKFYGPAVKAIEGNWISGDNLDAMNALTQGGRMSLEQAAKMTWTGRMAAQHGYTEVEINHYTGESGKLANMKVTFRKKPGS